MIILKSYIFIKRHIILFLGIFMYSCLLVFMYYYFITLLNNNQLKYENDIINLFTSSFIFASSQIIGTIDRFTESTNAVFKLTSNISLTQYQSITHVELDPFINVYNNYRYSRLIYDDNLKEAIDFGKKYINSHYNIDNTSGHGFYIPLDYSDPTFFDDSTFGFDLYNFDSIHDDFFGRFKQIDHKVITTTIPFFRSIDNYDLGMYIGKINHNRDKCNITTCDNFDSLINGNINNRKCILGFSFVASIIRDYIDNTLILTGDFTNLKSSNLPYVVVNNDLDNNIKVISRSSNLINVNIHKLNDIEKFVDNYYKHIKIENFLLFKNNSVHDNNVIYIFFKKTDIQNDEINNEILFIHIIIPILYTLTLIVILVIYYSYIHYLNLSRDKYIELKKIMTYVNHELRNPLNIIYGTSQFIEEKIQHCIAIDEVNIALLKELHSNIMTIQNSARISSLIVNDILDLQKLEDNKIIVNECDFSCLELISDFCKTVIHKQNEVLYDVKTLIFMDKQIVFNTDKDRLLQIMVNIYTNSIKHTDSGVIQIIVKLSSDEKFIHITMSDTGEGMTDEIKNDVFKKTFIDKKRSVNSVGIGLYIVGMLTKILKYNIIMTSEVNVGTEYEIIIKNSKSSVDVENNMYNDQIKDNVTFIDSKSFAIETIDYDKINMIRGNKYTLCTRSQSI